MGEEDGPWNQNYSRESLPSSWAKPFRKRIPLVSHLNMILYSDNRITSSFLLKALGMLPQLIHHIRPCCNWHSRRDGRNASSHLVWSSLKPWSSGKWNLCNIIFKMCLFFSSRLSPPSCVCMAWCGMQSTMVTEKRYKREGRDGLYLK